MEISRAPLVCVALIVMAFIYVMLFTGPAKPTANAMTATAQSVHRRDAYEQARRDWHARYTPTPVDLAKPVQPPVISPEYMEYLAWHRAKQEVLSVLHTPSVAKFPRETVRVTKWDETLWVIQGAVDSQNIFGAMLRQPYHVSVRYHGPLETASVSHAAWWTPETLQVGRQWYHYEKPKKASSARVTSTTKKGP